jgi:thiamine-monophosphate kinase
VELSFVRWLRERVAADQRVPLGIGDDAALVEVRPGLVSVVTTDMLMEGVDFRLDEAQPRLVGRKSLAVNLSDLAAMGAEPVAAFVSVALPRRGGERLARELLEGILDLAQQFDTAIAGGDTNSWDGPLVINITAVGEVRPERAWTRSGARPGDRIVVTGSFGGSILGKHLTFTPHIEAAKWLAANANVHAGMDVSDGLSLDLSRMLAESGCGAVLDLDHLPISEAAHELARIDGKSAVDHALSDGEDFELLLAVPPAEAERLVSLQPVGVPLADIGEFVESPGLWSRDSSGGVHPLSARGYEHRLE